MWWLLVFEILLYARYNAKHFTCVHTCIPTCHLISTSCPSCESFLNILLCHPASHKRQDVRISNGWLFKDTLKHLSFSSSGEIRTFLSSIMCNWRITLITIRGFPGLIFGKDGAIATFPHFFIMPFRIPPLSVLLTTTDLAGSHFTIQYGMCPWRHTLFSPSGIC